MITDDELCSISGAFAKSRVRKKSRSHRVRNPFFARSQPTARHDDDDDDDEDDELHNLENRTEQNSESSRVTTRDSRVWKCGSGALQQLLPA